MKTKKSKKPKFNKNSAKKWARRWEQKTESLPNNTYAKYLYK